MPWFVNCEWNIFQPPSLSGWFDFTFFLALASFGAQVSRTMMPVLPSWGGRSFHIPSFSDHFIFQAFQIISYFKLFRSFHISSFSGNRFHMGAVKRIIYTGIRQGWELEKWEIVFLFTGTPWGDGWSLCITLDDDHDCISSKLVLTKGGMSWCHEHRGCWVELWK